MSEKRKLPLPMLQEFAHSEDIILADKVSEEPDYEMNIDTESYMLLSEMIDSIKNLPLCAKDFNDEYINELNDKKDLLDETVRFDINNYIDFLSKQKFLGGSFACRECMMQRNIYEHLKKMPTISELEDLDINLVEEYEKYIERDPKETNKLIIEFLNSDLVDFFIFNDEIIDGDAKTTPKIEKMDGGGLYGHRKRNDPRRMMVESFVVNTKSAVSSFMDICGGIYNRLTYVMNEETSKENTELVEDVAHSSLVISEDEPLVKLSTSTQLINLRNKVAQDSQFIQNVIVSIPQTKTEGFITSVIGNVLKYFIDSVSLFGFAVTSLRDAFIKRPKLKTCFLTFGFSVIVPLIMVWCSYNIPFIIGGIASKIPVSFLSTLLIKTSLNQTFGKICANAGPLLISTYLAPKYIEKLSLVEFTNKLKHINPQSFGEYNYDRRMRLYSLIVANKQLVIKLKEINYPIEELFEVLQRPHLKSV